MSGISIRLTTWPFFQISTNILPSASCTCLTRVLLPLSFRNWLVHMVLNTSTMAGCHTGSSGLIVTFCATCTSRNLGSVSATSFLPLVVRKVAGAATSVVQQRLSMTTIFADAVILPQSSTLTTDDATSTSHAFSFFKKESMLAAAFGKSLEYLARAWS